MLSQKQIFTIFDGIDEAFDNSTQKLAVCGIQLVVDL